MFFRSRRRTRVLPLPARRLSVIRSGFLRVRLGGRPNDYRLLALLLLASTHRSARSTASSRICPGPLAASGHPSPVAEPAIAADVHESFDIHGDLTPEVTFYPHFFVDDVAQAVDFIVCQVPNTRVWIDSGAS